MSERYLFRGKREGNKEWIEGDLVHTWATTQGAVIEIYTLDMSYEVIPETVGQCSEVSDINGTLMYEGDIVNGMFDFGMPIKSICAFRNGHSDYWRGSTGLSIFTPSHRCAI